MTTGSGCPRFLLLLVPSTWARSVVIELLSSYGKLETPFSVQQPTPISLLHFLPQYKKTALSYLSEGFLILLSGCLLLFCNPSLVWPLSSCQICLEQLTCFVWLHAVPPVKIKTLVSLDKTWNSFQKWRHWLYRNDLSPEEHDVLLLVGLLTWLDLDLGVDHDPVVDLDPGMNFDPDPFCYSWGLWLQNKSRQMWYTNAMCTVRSTEAQPICLLFKSISIINQSKMFLYINFLFCKNKVLKTVYTPNAVVELLPHRHCVGATLIAP